MILLDRCPVCRQADFHPYALRYRSGYPHAARARCRRCGAIFANPAATESELTAFYSEYYGKGNFEADEFISSHTELFRESEKGGASIEREAAGFRECYRVPECPGGRFLDVGVGLGRSLLCAARLGYEVFGTDLDQAAVNFCRQHIAYASLHTGDLFSAEYPGEHFDYVLFHHVIEHVPEPVRYLGELRRILKPGGLLFIGTPRIDCLAYRIHRGMMYASGRIPTVVDGLEHTVLFPRALLRSLVLEAGLEIVEHRAERHNESWRKIIFSSAGRKRKLVRAIQKVASCNQRLLARKPALTPGGLPS
jgi:2-polyprenyl-3-methyl-5-hydroxy-6-metoxy-1,4-benzoquinol methylase